MNDHEQNLMNLKQGSAMIAHVHYEQMVSILHWLLNLQNFFLRWLKAQLPYLFPICGQYWAYHCTILLNDRNRLGNDAKVSNRYGTRRHKMDGNTRNSLRSMDGRHSMENTNRNMIPIPNTSYCIELQSQVGYNNFPSNLNSNPTKGQQQVHKQVQNMGNIQMEQRHNYRRHCLDYLQHHHQQEGLPSLDPAMNQHQHYHYPGLHLDL